MLEDYGPGGTEDPDTFTSVQYFTSGAPSTPWGSARASFYDVSGVPTVWFDGITSVVGASSASSAYTNYRNTYLARMGVATDVTIDLAGDLDTGQTYDVTCAVCVEEGGSLKTMRIYVVQVLDDWPTVSDHYPHNTFKQAAATQDVTLVPGDCTEITRSFTFDTDSWNNQSDIKIIAWAQVPDSPGPAEVYQTLVMGWPFPPAGARGDDCDSAVFAGNGSYSGFTTEATNDGSASCGDSATSPDLWYRYRARASGTLRVDTCGSSFDTVLSIHTECTGGSELDCNDDADTCGAGSPQSQAIASVTIGELYLIRLAGHSGATGDYVLNIDGPEDLTAPSPDPMSFSSPPATVNESEIEMTASLATDLGSPPVLYEFELSTSGGGGGTSSGWQSSRDYSDDGLDPDSAYTYRVRARDASLNSTLYSSPATAYTLAVVPGMPTFSNVSVSRMDPDIDPAGNPAHTEFALYCFGSAPDDPNWELKYVDAAGEPSDTAVWLTDAEWDSIRIKGLMRDVNYCWRVKARNQEGIETAMGNFECERTTVMPAVTGDLDDDGAVDLDDYVIYNDCMSGPDVTVRPPACGEDEFDYADVRPDDGDVDLEDFAGCIESFSGV